MKLINRAMRSILLFLVMLVVSACQVQSWQFNQSIATPEGIAATPLPSESQPQPTATPLIELSNITPELTETLETPKTVPAEDLKGLKLTLVHPWVNEAGDAFDALVAAFNQTNQPGIEVISRREAGFEALSQALIDGTVPDDLVLARGSDLAGVDDGTTWVNLSAVPGVEGMMQELGTCSDCKDYLDQDHLERYVTLLFQPALLFYNQTWAEELGFDQPPRTLEALQEQMRAAAAALLEDQDYDNNGAGGVWLSMTSQSALSWYRAFGGVFSPDDALSVFEREPIENSFSYLKDLRSTYGSWRAQNPTAYQYFVKRSALAYEGTLEDLLPQEVAGEVAGSTDQWITLPYPTIDGHGSISLETASISIRAADEKTEAAAAYFVRWLLNPERLNAMVEATGLWPVGGSPRQIAPAYAEQHPAWASALDPTVRLSVAPEAKNWGLSHLILQDAAMRVYPLDAQFIPTILDMLDATLIEAGGAK